MWNCSIIETYVWNTTSINLVLALGSKGIRIQTHRKWGTKLYATVQQEAEGISGSQSPCNTQSHIWFSDSNPVVLLLRWFILQFTHMRMRRAQLWGNSLHHVIFQDWEIKSYFHSRFGTLILVTVKTTFLYTSWSCLEQHIKHKGRIVPKLAVISPGFYPATLEGRKVWMVFPSFNFVSVIILVKKKSHLHNSTCFTVAFTYHYSFLLARLKYQQVKALRHFFPHK